MKTHDVFNRNPQNCLQNKLPKVHDFVFGVLRLDLRPPVYCVARKRSVLEHNSSAGTNRGLFVLFQIERFGTKNEID
ncbi:hypothetical protein [Arthrobacter glacialis]|uniref:hypothetical protein n=1 Tax=Arthrobacter glacialis TaxID=1664 RepID=UPI001057030D|nr:hypothetical protein [Arthrobacter glacialis]